MVLKRNGALDSLRGFAALLVFVLHAVLYLVAVDDRFTDTDWLPAFAKTFNIGRVGVVIFFALSGYLIARSLNAKDWRISFPIKRFFRLYPLFLASALGVLWIYGESYPAATVAANLTLLPSFFQQPELLELYWTLQTEVVFYALFFFLKLSGALERRRSLALLSAGFTLIFIASQLLLADAYLETLPLLFKKLPQHLGIMFFGAYLSTLDGSFLTSRPALLLLGLVLAPPLYTLGEYALRELRGPLPVMTSYLTAMALFLLALAVQPSHGIAEWLGRISYSIYLSHLFVIQLLSPHLPSVNLPLSVALLLMPTLAISALCYAIIERPGISFSRRVCQRLATRSEPAAGVPPTKALP